MFNNKTDGKSWKRRSVWIFIIPCWYLPIPLQAQNPLLAGGSEAPAFVAEEILPSVPLSLTRFGFEPAEIFIKVRRFYLEVANYTGQSDLTFVLERDKNRVITIKVPPHLFRTHDLLDLVPGQYRLYEETRPKWECLLNIETSPPPGPFRAFLPCGRRTFHSF